MTCFYVFNVGTIHPGLITLLCSLRISVFSNNGRRKGAIIVENYNFIINRLRHSECITRVSNVAIILQSRYNVNVHVHVFRSSSGTEEQGNISKLLLKLFQKN